MEKEQPQEREFEVLSVTVDAWSPKRGTGYMIVPAESVVFDAWAPEAGQGCMVVGRILKAVFRVWSHQGAPSLGRQTFRLEGTDVVFVDKSTPMPVEKPVEKAEEKPEEKFEALADLEAEVMDVVSELAPSKSHGKRWLIALSPKDVARFYPVLSTMRHGGNPCFCVFSAREPCRGPGAFEVFKSDGVTGVRWLRPVSVPTSQLPQKPEEKPGEKPLVLACLEADVKDVVSQTQRDSRNSRGNKWLITLPPKERARFPVGPDIRHGGDPCLEVYSVNEPQTGPGAFELFDHMGETRVRWLGPGSGASKTPQMPLETDHSAEFRNLLRAFCRQHNIAMLETQPSELDAFQGPVKQQATAYLTDRVQKCSHCNQDELVKADPVRDMLVNLALNAVISIDTRRCTQLWVECRCVNTTDGVGIYVAKLWWLNRVD